MCVIRKYVGVCVVCKYVGVCVICKYVGLCVIRKYVGVCVIYKYAGMCVICIHLRQKCKLFKHMHTHRLTHTHTHTHSHTHTDTHTSTQSCSYSTHMHAHTHAHTYTQTHTPAGPGNALVKARGGREGETSSGGGGVEGVRSGSPERTRLRKMVDELRHDRQRLEDRLCGNDPKVCVRACVRACVCVCCVCVRVCVCFVCVHVSVGGWVDVGVYVDVGVGGCQVFVSVRGRLGVDMIWVCRHGCRCGQEFYHSGKRV